VLKALGAMACGFLSSLARLPLLLLALTAVAGAATSRGTAVGGTRFIGRFPMRRLTQQPPMELNPCTPQRVAKGRSYVLAILHWPGAHINEALGPSGTTPNPCVDATFSQRLAHSNATVEVFEVQVDTFTVLRTYLPNLEKLPEQAEALVGAQGFPLKISFIFSNEFVSTPRVVASVDAAFSLAEGVVQQETVVLASDLDTYSVTPHSSEERCPGCAFNSTAYLAAVGVTPPPAAPALNFTCINGIHCAWGTGFCAACLDGLQRGAVRTQHDWFDAAFVAGGANSTNAARHEACVTFCHTLRYIMWFGADFDGHMLRSQDVQRTLLPRYPLAALGAFPRTFGLSASMLAYLGLPTGPNQAHQSASLT